MSYWTDTHAHIYLEDFDADRAEMLDLSVVAGVKKILLPNIDHTSIDRMLELEARSPEICHAMIGLHPCSVNRDFEKELYLVEDWLSRRQFLAIGEMGTDLYWDKTFWPEQQEAFRIQVAFATRYDLPLVIHCRESLDETIELVAQLKNEKVRGVFHCFTGSVEQAEKIADLGFYVGIGGVATFKNGGMDKIIPSLSLDRIVLETDSPYLAPVPHRGKRNQPSYIPLIAARVAELKNISLNELQVATTQNAQSLFGWS